MAININLKNLIKDKGYTIVKLSNEINITPVNLSKLINNRVSEVKLDTLNKICDVLKCTPGDILQYHSQTKKKVIPFFLDYVGGTDDILEEGIDNFKKFLTFTKKFQETTNIEIKIILITGLPFESAKSKFKLLDKLAESYDLPNLFYGTSIEYCGFFMDKNKVTQLKTIDSRIIEKRLDIEMIANQYNTEINKQYSSIYNIFFSKPISRSKLSEVSYKLDEIINCNEIESVTYFDKYGCEIDIKNVNHSKSAAVLMIMNNLKIEYEIPLIVIGGAPIRVNWEMYSNSKLELNKIGYSVLGVLTTGFDEAKEVDHNDTDIVFLDLKNYTSISKLFAKINTKLNIKNRSTGIYE